MRKDSGSVSSCRSTITVPVHCRVARVTVKEVEKFDGSKETVVDTIDDNGGHLAVIHWDNGHSNVIGEVRPDSITGVLTSLCPWCDSQE